MLQYDLGLKDFRWDFGDKPKKKLLLRHNLRELKMAIKRAFDRLWTGVDRQAYWSADYFYMAHMQHVLEWYLENRSGSPVILPCVLQEDKLCGEPLEDKEKCKQCTVSNHDLWNKELEFVIGQIKDWRLATDSFDPQSDKDAKTAQDKIFDWFKKYWRTLWD